MAGVAAIVLVAAACTPTPPGPTTTTTTIAEPTSPVISEFRVAGGVGPAPAVVALVWDVSDPNGDPLVCHLDTTGDGTHDVVIDPCPQVGSRNVSIAEPGTIDVQLVVDDGTTEPAVAERTIVAPAGVSESYEIELRGVESLSPGVAGVFDTASQRWEELIVRGTPDFPIIPRPPCLPAESPSLPSTIDDVIIDVAVEPIDGPGGILGEAGPTCISLANELPLHGVMIFDSDDVATMASEGTLSSVILHEMGHVLGIGTLWDLAGSGGSRQVISGAGGPDPRYTGPRGVAEYSALGPGGTVPVESLGGPGTRDGHWRESVFGNELMTGWIDAGANPLSRLTLASLADLGYQVDLAGSDPYSLPGGFSSLRSTTAAAGGLVTRPPIGGLTPPG